MKIVADDKIPFLRGALEPLGQVVYKQGRAITRDDLLYADAVITRTRTKCDASLLSGTAVRGIFTATIGFDHIDTRYCQESGIYWENAPACNSRSVEQYYASALAVLSKRCGMRIGGLTVAVVGVGHVGSLVAEVSRKMGMEVLLVDPPRARAEGAEGYVSLHEAMAQADIVTFHTPLTMTGSDATYHLLNSESLRWLKHGAVVMNTSRGPVCDTLALIEGLESGQIGQAVIDVWENEPNISRLLMDRVLIATPHIAGYSTDSKLRGTTMAVSALCRYFGVETPWSAPALPLPVAPVFSPVSSSTAEENALSMFLHVYDIEADCAMLRANAEAFEALRGDYHLRREIDSFSLADGAPYADYLRSFGIK